MKRIVCVLVAMGVVAAMGCAKQEPEKVARDFVERQIATKHEGFILDTSDLEYNVVEKGDDYARVRVTGEIDIKGELTLTKDGDRWVMGSMPAAMGARPGAMGARPGAPAMRENPQTRRAPAVAPTTEKTGEQRNK